MALNYSSLLFFCPHSSLWLTLTNSMWYKWQQCVKEIFKAGFKKTQSFCLYSCNFKWHIKLRLFCKQRAGSPGKWEVPHRQSPLRKEQKRTKYFSCFYYKWDARHWTHSGHSSLPPADCSCISELSSGQQKKHLMFFQNHRMFVCKKKTYECEALVNSSSSLFNYN